MTSNLGFQLGNQPAVVLRIELKTVARIGELILVVKLLK